MTRQKRLHFQTVTKLQFCECLCRFIFPIFRREIRHVGVTEADETRVRSYYRPAPIITPTGGLLIDDGRPKYHSGTDAPPHPPSRGKQWNQHCFNQPRLMDLMTKSFSPLHFMGGGRVDTFRIRPGGGGGLTGLLLCESRAVNKKRCFF